MQPWSSILLNGEFETKHIQRVWDRKYLIIEKHAWSRDQSVAEKTDTLHPRYCVACTVGSLEVAQQCSWHSLAKALFGHARSRAVGLSEQGKHME